MLYGASGDVRGELGNPSEVEYSSEDINRARTKATNLVDSYISSAYPSQTPFTNTADVPALINTLSDDLSVYFAKRAKHPGMSPLTEDVKTEYYDKSIKLLEQIRDGELEIPELESKRGNIISSTSTNAYTPTFAEDDETGWNIDTDKLDDISDTR